MYLAVLENFNLNLSLVCQLWLFKYFEKLLTPQNCFHSPSLRLILGWNISGSDCSLMINFYLLGGICRLVLDYYKVILLDCGNLEIAIFCRYQRHLLKIFEHDGSDFIIDHFKLGVMMFVSVISLMFLDGVVSLANLCIWKTFCDFNIVF